MACTFVKFCRVIALGQLVMFCLAAQAAGWDVTPFIGVQEVYSDNIEHSLDAEKADGFVTELSPGLKAILNSKRLQADIYYKLQALYYSEDSANHESYQQLRAKINSELVQESVFVDTQASISQQVIDPSQPVSFRNTAISTNQTDVRTASINPYWQLQWNGNIQSLLSVRGSKVDYTESGSLALPDSQVISSKANISTGDSPQSAWGLGLGASRDEIKYSNDVSNEFGQAYVYSRIRLTAKAALNLTVGDESNKFETLNGKNPDGSFWELGLRVMPSLHQHLEIKTGHRSFGTTGALDWWYTGRKWKVEAQYQEDFFTDAQRQLEVGGNADLRSAGTDLSQAATGVYLRERAETRLDYNWSRTIIYINAYAERRDFQTIDRLDIVHGGQLGWEWRVKANTYVLFEYKLRRDELNFGELENRVNLRSLSFRKRLSTLVNVKLQLGRENLESTTVLNQYRENWLALSMEREF